MTFDAHICVSNIDVLASQMQEFTSTSKKPYVITRHLLKRAFDKSKEPPFSVGPFSYTIIPSFYRTGKPLAAKHSFAIDCGTDRLRVEDSVTRP